MRTHLRVLEDADEDLALTYRALATRTAQRATGAGLLPDHAAKDVLTILEEGR